MRRVILAAATAGVLVAASAASASAGQPRIYHVIKDTRAYAAATQVVGCLETSVWIGSSEAMYTGRPSGLNKQARTTVDIVVRDACAGPEGAVSAAAAPGGVVFEASGESAVPPVIDTRLTKASLRTEFTNGDGVPFSVDVAWTGSGSLGRDHVNTHVNEGIGVVSSTSNEVRRDAAAEVRVSVGGHDLTATTSDAFLSTLRFRCIEVPRPGTEDYYPCFGFPA